MIVVLSARRSATRPLESTAPVGRAAALPPTTRCGRPRRVSPIYVRRSPSKPPSEHRRASVSVLASAPRYLSRRSLVQVRSDASLCPPVARRLLRHRVPLLVRRLYATNETQQCTTFSVISSGDGGRNDGTGSGAGCRVAAVVTLSSTLWPVEAPGTSRRAPCWLLRRCNPHKRKRYTC